jgi:hypothetical protein
MLQFLEFPELCLIKIISFLDSNSTTNFLEFIKNENTSLYNTIHYRLNQIIRNIIPVIREIEYIHRNISNINTTGLFMKHYSRIFSLMRCNETPSSTVQTIVSYKSILNSLNNNNSSNITQKDKKKFNHIVFTKTELFNFSKPNDQHIRVSHDNIHFNLKCDLLTDYISLEINN